MPDTQAQPADPSASQPTPAPIAEPAIEISEDAIEAAAKAEYEADGSVAGTPWEEIGENLRAQYTEPMACALAAALPFLEQVTRGRRQPMELGESCREWVEDRRDRCNERSDFILWGKFFAPEALGPRCKDHARQHLGWASMSQIDQYAVYDLRRVAVFSAELAVLRAQRDAALEACTETIHAPMLYAQTHDLVDEIRAALGVQPEPDLASVEEADMQAEHDAEFHGGPV